MSDIEPLQELSPAHSSFDNTDVKVPVMSRLIEPQCTIPVCDNLDASYTCSPEDIVRVCVRSRVFRKDIHTVDCSSADPT